MIDKEWKPRRIVSNKLKCLKCGDVMESTHRHDFKMCSCRSCFIDGGHDYVRVGGNPGDFVLMTEYEDEETGEREVVGNEQLFNYEEEN